MLQSMQHVHDEQLYALSTLEAFYIFRLMPSFAHAYTMIGVWHVLLPVSLPERR